MPARRRAAARHACHQAHRETERRQRGGGVGVFYCAQAGGLAFVRRMADDRISVLVMPRWSLVGW